MASHYYQGIKASDNQEQQQQQRQPPRKRRDYEGMMKSPNVDESSNVGEGGGIMDESARRSGKKAKKQVRRRMDGWMVVWGYS